MIRTVLVTGASGFVGRSIVNALLSRNFGVRALINRANLSDTRVTSVRASIFDEAELTQAMRGCDAVIHLVGIIFERPRENITFERLHTQATRHVVAAAEAAGVKRYIHMSAIGADAGAQSRYHQTKFAAEQIVRNSSLDFTILRPSLIHGPGGEFTQMETAWARGTKPPFLFMPYFGGGLFGTGGGGKIQPILVSDVARAFVDAIDRPHTIRQAYDVGGTQQITWPQMHRIASTIIRGKPKISLPIPAWLAKFYAAVGIGSLLGFNRDQVVMSQQDNICDMKPFLDAFNFEPGGFEKTFAEYAHQTKPG